MAYAAAIYRGALTQESGTRAAARRGGVRARRRCEGALSRGTLGLLSKRSLLRQQCYGGGEGSRNELASGCGCSGSAGSDVYRTAAPPERVAALIFRRR